MSERKLLAQRIGLVGIVSILLELNNIILLPILTRSLPVEYYGIWVQIVVTIGLVPSLATIGLPYSLVRFLSSAKEKNEIQEIFYTIAFTIFFLDLIVSLLILYFSSQIAGLLFGNEVSIVRLLSFIVLIECLNSVFFNYFRAFGQIKKYSLFSLIRVVLNLSLSIYLLWLGYGIYGVVASLLITVSIEFLIMAFVIVSQIGIKIPLFRDLRIYLAFGIPTILGNISSWIVNSSDRYLIGIILGLAFVGYYSPGYTLGNMIYLLVSPFGFMLPAMLSKSYDEGNISEVKLVLSYSLKYFLAVAIPSAFGLTLLSQPILTIISTSDIASHGYLITPFTALSALLYGSYIIISQILVLEKETAILGAIWVLAAAMNFGLNLLLIPRLGIMGAAATTLIAYGLAFALTVHYSRKFFMFGIDLNFLYKSILASVLMSIPIMIIAPKDKLVILATISFCAALYFIILFALKGFKKEEVTFFREMLSI